MPDLASRSDEGGLKPSQAARKRAAAPVRPLTTFPTSAKPQMSARDTHSLRSAFRSSVGGPLRPRGQDAADETSRARASVMEPCLHSRAHVTDRLLPRAGAAGSEPKHAGLQMTAAGALAVDDAGVVTSDQMRPRAGTLLYSFAVQQHHRTPRYEDVSTRPRRRSTLA